MVVSTGNEVGKLGDNMLKDVYVSQLKESGMIVNSHFQLFGFGPSLGWEADQTICGGLETDSGRQYYCLSLMLNDPIVSHTPAIEHLEGPLSLEA